MNGYKIIFLVLAVVFISIYTYNYYTYEDNTTEIQSLKNSNNCILQNEINLYGTIETKDFTINIPNTWKVKTFENAQINSFVLGINEYDNTEFLSIWIGDYNKSSHDFLINTLKPLSNYKIIDEKEISTNIGTVRNIRIEFSNTNSYTQDMYAIIKNNKAYLILLRTQTSNYNKYTDVIQKIICGFNTKN
jgi:hypothetical protein